MPRASCRSATTHTRAALERTLALSAMDDWFSLELPETASLADWVQDFCDWGWPEEAADWNQHGSN